MDKRSWSKAGMVMAMILGGSMLAPAQNITSFNNGMITFENPNTNRYYRVEFKPSLTGPESTEWQTALPVNIRSSDAEVTVPAGVFYRVVASETPFVAGDGPTASLPRTGQTQVWVSGDDATHQKGTTWPSPRFTDHDDGTVTDNLTGLMWTKNANLDGSKEWADAIGYCNALDYGGYTDWRLPNVRELHSLIDYGRTGPAIQTGPPFTGVQLAHYWSSSTYMQGGHTSYAWSVSMNAGSAIPNHLKTTALFVWPVRGGQ